MFWLFCKMLGCDFQVLGCDDRVWRQICPRSQVNTGTTYDCVQQFMAIYNLSQLYLVLVGCVGEPDTEYIASCYFTEAQTVTE